jgi:hypothetical protein
MIKDIIANLSVTENGSVVGNYAASVAAVLQAHLTGVAFIYDPVVPISVGGYNPAEVIEAQRVDNETAAESAIGSFTAASNRAGISAEPLTLSASLAGAADKFARMARRFDLAIVGQPEMSRMEWIIGETTLFESGCPMIMVPYIQKGPFKIDNAMICWDGSRAAARAVADAIPILGKSGRVEIVIVTNEPVSNTISRALILASISRAMDSKWMSTGFSAAISMSPTLCCRTPLTGLPTS